MKTYIFGFYLILSFALRIDTQESKENVNLLYNLQNETIIEKDSYLLESQNHSSNVNTSEEKSEAKCETKVYAGNFTVLENGHVFIHEYNKSYPPAEFEIKNGKVFLCFLKNLFIADTTAANSIEKCEKWIYTPDEFEVFSNGSVSLDGEILQNGTYKLNGDNLEMCITDDYDYTSEDPDNTQKEFNYAQYSALIYIGKAGAIISVIALILHLVIFFLTSSLRNLPGYNLTSLSVAFLLAYLFLLIGQIPEVLGTPCVVSSVLELYFFLAAFFWMNVMAFDIWRALRLAVLKLVTSSNCKKKKKFILYSIYGWGMPLFISITAITLDNVKTVSDTYKPLFGANSVCWFTNDTAKITFFMAPVFSLLISNGIFFCMSAYIIIKNSMTDTNAQHGEEKRNFVLYARLGVIMGVTWLAAIAGIIFRAREIWFVFDFLNSLQGLFIFLLFSCSPKIWKKLNARAFHQVSKSYKSSSGGTKSDVP